MAGPASPQPLETRSYQEWKDWLRALVADPRAARIHRQPIIDLSRGSVAGYEVLARFDGARPDQVFPAAASLGMSEALETAIVRSALEGRGELPANCFLSVNVSPDALASEELGAILAQEDLGGVIFEITEHIPVHDYAGVTRAVNLIRARGGMFAVDDAGAGYASLRHVLTLRPQFVKLDRSLIMGLARDPAKRAVVELLGQLTSKIDSWVVAEGIEKPSELHEVLALGVPLAQGYLLGRPGAGHPGLERNAQALIAQRQQTLTDDVDAIVRLVVHTTPVDSLGTARRAFADNPDCTEVPVVDGGGRAVGIVRRADVEAGRWQIEQPLYVEPAAPVARIARRAASRTRSRRYDPLVCRAPDGQYVGLIEVDRMLDALAARAIDG